MKETITTVITENVLEIVLTFISLAVSYYVIPCIKSDLIPWLKEKHLYDTVVKFVNAVEKLYESGIVEKGNKKQMVIELLQEQGIEVNTTVEAYIESAVKELDLITNTIIEEIKKDEKELENL